MAFAKFIRISDGKVHYVFEGDEHRLPSIVDDFIKLPPNPTVIIATTVYMTEDPQLDSFKSVYELDRALTEECADDREMKAYQQARIDY
jgi:hypothetical protein